MRRRRRRRLNVGRAHVLNDHRAWHSSTPLSSTSHTRWCNPLVPVLPMYIPGRFRTAGAYIRPPLSSTSAHSVGQEVRLEVVQGVFRSC